MFYGNGWGKGFERLCYSIGGIAGFMELTGWVMGHTVYLFG
jgi:hypothetical protein